MNHLFNFCVRSTRRVFHKTFCAYVHNVGQKTAGIIVIGDEILRADVPDSNAYFISRRLRKLGVRLDQVLFIPDNRQTISEKVREFAHNYDFVFTSGGIGPTHDDLTYESVAAAFGESLQLHPRLWPLVESIFANRNIDESVLRRFATVPESSELLLSTVVHGGRSFTIFVVKVHNVLVLPGVPWLLQKLFNSYVERYMIMSDNHQKTTFYEDVYVATDEINIAGTTNELAEKFKHSVSIGLYPEFFHNYYKVRVRFEGEKESVICAKTELINALPESVIVKYDRHPTRDAWKKLQAFQTTHPYAKDAVDIVEEALNRYKPEEICVSMSGGKDCTVIVHIYHACLQHRYPDNTPKAQWFNVTSNKGHPEVAAFITKSCVEYNAEILTYTGPFKSALQQVLSERPAIKAFLLGQRITDPRSEALGAFMMTDKDWPQAMRVFPALHWSYRDIWTFIRGLYLSYCPLYDMGYSSLGDNSQVNPALIIKGASGISRFKPAYMLQDESMERNGR